MLLREWVQRKVAGGGAESEREALQQLSARTRELGCRVSDDTIRRAMRGEWVTMRTAWAINLATGGEVELRSMVPGNEDR